MLIPITEKRVRRGHVTGDLIRARQRIKMLSLLRGGREGVVRLCDYFFLIYRVFVERFENLPEFYLRVSYVNVKKRLQPVYTTR